MALDTPNPLEFQPVIAIDFLDKPHIRQYKDALPDFRPDRLGRTGRGRRHKTPA